MQPVVFTIPFINREVPGYGLMLMVGFLVAIWWAARRADRSGANPDVVLNCGFIALIAGVVGCRFMYVVHYWDQFKDRGTAYEIFWAIIDVTKGGLEFYGGFILSAVLILAWLRWYERVSIRWYMDIIAPSGALGLAIGRIGCFLNGCCFGGVCDLPWAVEFPYASPAIVDQWRDKTPGAELPEQLLFSHDSVGFSLPLYRENLAMDDDELADLDRRQAEVTRRIADLRERIAAAPQQSQALNGEIRKLEPKLQALAATAIDVRTNMKKYGMTAAELRELAVGYPSLAVHPTQIYSTITALLVALFLNALYWRRSRDGQVIFALFLIEPVTRWLLEVIRADNPVDTLGLLTISQGLALAMTLVGLAGLIWLRTLPPRSRRAEVWVPPEPTEAPKDRGAKKGGKRAASAN